MDTVLADRYALRSEIARGAVGVVWRALDRVTGEEVAVKVLREEMRDESEIVECFFLEAEILNAIEHPGVIGVRDFIVTDRLLAIVLELAEGPDLRERLRLHGPLPAAEAAVRCAAAAETLDAVHRAGYLHGDVKPGNLMLAGAEGVKFIDFGIARAAQSTTLPSHGTPEYTAPEVAAGESACPGIDNYALGLVLYEALTGHSAYRGGSISEVLDRQLRMIPVRPATVDPELWTIVEALLSIDPRGRGDLAEIAAELRRLAPRLSGRATAPIEPRLRERGGAAAASEPLTPPAAEEAPETHSAPRRRVLAAVGVAVLALAGIGAAVLFALPSGDRPDGTDVADPTTSAETAEPTDEPTPEPTDEPEEPATESAEADSGTPSAETDELSDSEGEDDGFGGSTEGVPVDEVPGSDVLGSPMPGN